MTELKCTAINCASNKNNCCCQPAIKVQGKSATSCEATRCQSFVGKGKDEVSNATSFCEPNCKCEVKCTAANCTYNKIGDCSATCVNIKGDNALQMSETECRSFQGK